MSTNERRVDYRVIAIARFAKFIDKYYSDIDWTLVAQSCGVIDILDAHERVRRAKWFGDPDYSSAVSSFMLEVFKTDEQAGILLVNEIISGMGVLTSPEATEELEQILSLFGGKQADKSYLLANLPSLTVEKLVEVTDIPDDFYKKLIDEINHLYKQGLILSLSVLIRKLLENLLIDILRKRYGTSELTLYYDPSKRRFLDFSILLKNFENRIVDFQHVTSNLDNKLIVRVHNIVNDFISKKVQDIVNCCSLLTYRSGLHHAFSESERAWTRNKSFDCAGRRSACACRVARNKSFGKSSS